MAEQGPQDHRDGEARRGNGEANDAHAVVGVQEVEDMRAAIRTLHRTLYGVLLGESLNDVRSIEIRFVPDAPAAGGEQGPPQPPPGDEEARQPPPAPRGRLSIKVASEQEDAEKEFLDKMRGWLMTVAALFVNMAFTAGSKPPDWMPRPHEWFDTVFISKNATMEAKRVATNAAGYLLLNTLTFAIALSLVVLLMVMKRSQPGRTLRTATALLIFLAVCIGLNFASSISEDKRVTVLVLGVMVVYGFIGGVVIRCKDYLAAASRSTS